MPSFFAAQENVTQNEESSKSYKKLISTFPKTEGWNLLNYLYQYQGFWYHPMFLEGIMSAQDQFKTQPTDIVLCSAPKTGTTWLKALTFATATRNSFDDSPNPLLSRVPHECVPLVEMDLNNASSTRDPELPLLAIHMPYNSLPKSVLESGCKIVYICRDPKDAFVSMYHFVRRQLKQRNLDPLSLEQAFELYYEGKCYYGPYWDHVEGHWKASLERSDKILFLKYEE